LAKASTEQKEVALETGFEEGLLNPDMQQYLRLHAIGDTFPNSVHKARRFAATKEVPMTLKSVRITTPPAHEAVQMIPSANGQVGGYDHVTPGQFAG